MFDKRKVISVILIILTFAIIVPCSLSHYRQQGSTEAFSRSFSRPANFSELLMFLPDYYFLSESKREPTEKELSEIKNFIIQCSKIFGEELVALIDDKETNIKIFSIHNEFLYPAQCADYDFFIVQNPKDISLLLYGLKCQSAEIENFIFLKPYYGSIAIGSNKFFQVRKWDYDLRSMNKQLAITDTQDIYDSIYNLLYLPHLGERMFFKNSQDYSEKITILFSAWLWFDVLGEFQDN